MGVNSDFLESLPFRFLAILVALTLSRYAQAWMATRCGDPTPRFTGRLSLNPLAHVDPFGVVLITLVGFGWAKEIPYNPGNFRKKWDEFFVALAGPTMNLVIGVFCFIVVKVGFLKLVPEASLEMFTLTFRWMMLINFIFGLFSFIPVGPLDGHKILEGLLPLSRKAPFMNWNAQYGSYVLLGLILMEFVMRPGILGFLIFIPASLATEIAFL